MRGRRQAGSENVVTRYINIPQFLTVHILKEKLVLPGN
jgi:hypothetical protein